MTNLRSPSVILFFFVALSSLFTVNSYLIGVDIGSEFFKICLIKPGKPFSIVENLQSKLKTPTAISLKDDEITFSILNNVETVIMEKYKKGELSDYNAASILSKFGYSNIT